MDPLTQGVFGASLPQSLEHQRRYQKAAFVIGFLSGMAPDLDVLIRSSSDPLLALDFHRHFTHSLAFIPFGALICASVFYFLFKKKLSFKRVYLYAFLGYGTHALLDGCTSYGTRLFWPFSDARITWNNVSVVDPLVTLPMLALVLLGYFRGNSNFAKLALAYGLSYLLLGVVQRDRAEDIATELAHSRGHTPLRMTAKPSFGNIVLWKTIYEHDGHYYVDAVKIGLDKRLIPGTSVKKLDIATDLPWLDTTQGNQQAIDLERFRVFSDDYLAVLPNQANYVIDIRYSFLPNSVDPLWGIRMKPHAPNEHVDYDTTRNLNPEYRTKFFAMLFD
ncbi:MAG: metal-dependent hydrolase [Gammaproteobacteria bacterium]|nr:MAG: metal-dependent hydrolase [Gammaproteobacteria bacterium]